MDVTLANVLLRKSTEIVNVKAAYPIQNIIIANNCLL